MADAIGQGFESLRLHKLKSNQYVKNKTTFLGDAGAPAEHNG